LAEFLEEIMIRLHTVDKKVIEQTSLRFFEVSSVELV
jgi:hypothetical protein